MDAKQDIQDALDSLCGTHTTLQAALTAIAAAKQALEAAKEKLCEGQEMLTDLGQKALRLKEVIGE